MPINSKIYYSYYLERDSKFILILSPAEQHSDEQAEIFLRGSGYKNVGHDWPEGQLHCGLPSVNWVSGHSQREIELFLNALGEWWDFRSFKIIEIEKAQFKDQEDAVRDAVWKALVKRYSWSDLLNGNLRFRRFLQIMINN